MCWVIARPLIFWILFIIIVLKYFGKIDVGLASKEELEHIARMFMRHRHWEENMASESGDSDTPRSDANSQFSEEVASMVSRSTNASAFLRRSGSPGGPSLSPLLEMRYMCHFSRLCDSL